MSPRKKETMDIENKEEEVAEEIRPRGQAIVFLKAPRGIQNGAFGIVEGHAKDSNGKNLYKVVYMRKYYWVPEDSIATRG